MTEVTREVALITGATGGIGSAIARQLVADGFDLALSDVAFESVHNDFLKEIQSYGTRVKTFPVDALDLPGVNALVPAALAAFGRLDVLVNVAGIVVFQELASNSDADFERVLHINLRLAFVLSREASKVLPPGGRIVNIGSVVADRVPAPGLSLYAMAKSALAGLTRASARDLGPKQIRVNCVQPGPIDTALNPADSELAPQQVEATTLGRFGQPDEVAALVGFLARPDSGYMTGSVHNVDGGFNT
ncbi:MAG: SDR family NAD(P)-dependent oxidoreductase [Opitutales bacterium]